MPMFDSVYKLRHQKRKRLLWESAAIRSEKDLSVWMRDTLDQEAAAQILSPKK